MATELNPDSMISLQSLLSSPPTEADRELMDYQRFVACHDCGVVFSLKYVSVVGFCPVCESDSYIAALASQNKLQIKEADSDVLVKAMIRRTLSATQRVMFSGAACPYCSVLNDIKRVECWSCHKKLKTCSQVQYGFGKSFSMGGK